MCCDVCCKEFKGWCQSFTRTEKALTILEAVLLVVLVVFLIFLILHLLACSTPEPRYEEPKGEIEESEEYELFEETEVSSVATTKHTTKRPKPTKKKTTTAPRTTTSTITGRLTIEPGLECSWTPSAKTSAFTHYYEESSAQTTEATFTKFNAFTKTPKTAKRIATTKEHKKVDSKWEYNEDFIQLDQSDGEVADDFQTKQVLSLVKLKPPQGVVFGCILTIISKFHVLTSASCIEAIEEVDSLDSFVIMEQYGTSSNGKIHSILDLQIHPLYQGMNKSYDLAVIKSESSFVNGQAVQLQTPLDYSLTTIGERFHVLGFGSYRYLLIQTFTMQLLHPSPFQHFANSRNKRLIKVATNIC